MLCKEDTKIFEDLRPTLLGIGYRILGTLDDAEDVTQDTFIKWVNIDRRSIKDTKAWLTTVYTRRCLDILKASERTRLNYIGAWLPEPIHTLIANEEENNLDLSTSLKMAFILMLDRLTPKERAAFLLHEIFDISYSEVSKILEINQNTCRKLVSRAKQNIDLPKKRYITPVNRQEELLNAFELAIHHGKATKQLKTLLSNDIRLTADGGGKVPTLREILGGEKQVTTFIENNLHKYWYKYDFIKTVLNGEYGFILKDKGHTEAAVSFVYDDDGKVKDIFIIRNPEKLKNLKQVSIN